MNSTRIRLMIVTAAFICAFLLILWLADLGALPVTITRLYAFPQGDKVGHFLLMGLLSTEVLFRFLVNINPAHTRLARQKTGFSWRILLLASLMISVLITIEEFSQVLFQSRSFSLSDLFFSLLGIWFFACLAVGLAGKFRNK